MLKSTGVFALAAAVILLTLGGLASAQQTDKDDTIRIETSLISVPVIVSDRNGRYLAGLKASDFSITVDGKQQETAFFAAEDEPLRVAILLDTSRSTEGVLGKIKKAAREFIKLLNPADSAMIVAFDYDVHVVSPLTSDKRQLERAIKDVEIGEFPGTVMRDAVAETVAKHLASARGRKAIIMLTDGKDFGSYVYRNELSRSLEESDVMIYPIFYETTMLNQFRPMNRRNGRIGGGNFPRRQRNEDRIRRREEQENDRAREILNQMATLTGGRFYDKEDQDLDDIFVAIANELRGQYRLGFYPDESLSDSDSVHQIKVKVDRPGIVVRSRASYRVRK